MKVEKMVVAVGLVALLLGTGLSACSGAPALADEGMGALQGGCGAEYPCRSRFGSYCSMQGMACGSSEDCRATTIDGKICTSAATQKDCSTHKKKDTTCTPYESDNYCGYEGQVAWCAYDEESKRSECLIGPPQYDKPCPGSGADGDSCEGEIVA